MKKKSKRYKELLKTVVKDKKLSTKDILELVKKNSNSKFDESIDVSLRINLKQSKGGDFSLRTTIKLPNGSGKKEKIAVLCEPDKIDEAKKSGAEVVGSDDLIEKIAAGKFDFTKLICTPSMMSKIGKHGKVLGPKGLMPNPKTGTVTNDIKSTIENINKGLVAYKNDKAGTIHAALGKVSFDESKLTDNVTSFIDEIKKIKPSGLKGTFVNSVYLSSSMGFGLKVEI